jgi:hypothetical protein
MIGAPSCLINQGLQNSGDFLTTFAWSDGTVNETVNGTRDFAYSFDGMQFDLNVQPGTWQFSIYTSVWWAKGLVEFLDEDGNIIDVATYESKTAAAGSSEYRVVKLTYSADEAQTITVRNMPALAFDGHRGNMSFAAVTVESAIDHLSVMNADAPAINTALTAIAYASADDSLPLINNDGVSFQWQSSDEADGEFNDIEGATDAVYQPTQADIGKYLRISATFAGKTVSYTLTAPVFGLIYEPVFKDFKGETLETLSTNLINVTHRYYNPAEDGGTEFMMVVAVYDPDGRLIM